jgi:hypothetical protein
MLKAQTFPAFAVDPQEVQVGGYRDQSVSRVRDVVDKNSPTPLLVGHSAKRHDA